MLRALLILLATVLGGSLRAHTVPVIVIEAEFSSARDAVIKVNLDPRLFLNDQPTTLPPVPASWWFDQNDAAQTKSKRAAAEYVDRTFTFNVGAASLKGDWKVQAIDSASAFPLGQASAEVHLLLEHRGPLPSAPGDFKVAVGKECAVSVILLCGNAGEAERKPQALFPNETSRPFPLPPVPQTPLPSATSKESVSASGTTLPAFASLSPFGHFKGEHLVLAALLGIAWRQRWWLAPVALITFHASHGLATILLATGWLPSAPLWMVVAYWVALALAALHLLVLKSNIWQVLVTLLVAGFCHGLNTPGLPAEPAMLPRALRNVMSHTCVDLLWGLAILAACVFLCRLTRRRDLQSSCTTTA